MSRISQEFYCAKSGEGCGGYFIVRLNMAINHVVKIVCPKCGHEHQRCIVNGQIHEKGRYNVGSKEIIRPTMASYSPEPFTKKMREKNREERDGVLIDEGREPMFDRWLELAARERGETE